MDMSQHIKDLITVYNAMPFSPHRERIVGKLEEAYLLATSDALGATLNTKSATDTQTETVGLKTAENAPKYTTQKIMVTPSGHLIKQLTKAKGE